VNSGQPMLCSQIHAAETLDDCTGPQIAFLFSSFLESFIPIWLFADGQVPDRKYAEKAVSLFRWRDHFDIEGNLYFVPHNQAAVIERRTVGESKILAIDFRGAGYSGAL